MDDIETLFDQHRELLSLCNKILAILDGDPKDAGTGLARARWQLASLVGKHIASEDAFVRVPMRKSGDPVIIKTLQDYIADMIRMRMAFAEHNGKWNIAAIAADWPGYRNAVHALVNDLSRRIELTQRDIYPLARLCVARAARPPAAVAS